MFTRDVKRLIENKEVSLEGPMASCNSVATSCNPSGTAELHRATRMLALSWRHFLGHSNRAEGSNGHCYRLRSGRSHPQKEPPRKWNDLIILLNIASWNW